MNVLNVVSRTLLEMARAVVARLPMVAVAVVVFFAFYFGGKAIRSIVRRAARRHRNVGVVLGRLAMGGMTLLGALVLDAVRRCEGVLAEPPPEAPPPAGRAP